jgi:hypothetical protein
MRTLAYCTTFLALILLSHGGCGGKGSDQFVTPHPSAATSQAAHELESFLADPGARDLQRYELKLGEAIYTIATKRGGSEGRADLAIFGPTGRKVHSDTSTGFGWAGFHPLKALPELPGVLLYEKSGGGGHTDVNILVLVGISGRGPTTRSLLVSRHGTMPIEASYWASVWLDGPVRNGRTRICVAGKFGDGRTDFRAIRWTGEDWQEVASESSPGRGAAEPHIGTVIIEEGGNLVQGLRCTPSSLKPDKGR